MVREEAARRNAPVSRRVENYVYPAHEMAWTAKPDWQCVNQWVALDARERLAGSCAPGPGPLRPADFVESYDEFHYSTTLGATPAAGFSPQIH